MKVRDAKILKNGCNAGYIKQKDGSWKWSFLQKGGVYNVGNIVYDKNSGKKIKITHVNKDSVSGHLVTNDNGGGGSVNKKYTKKQITKNMNEITLYIYDINRSNLITITCDNRITIKDLKEIIAERIGDDCEYYYFYLIYKGRELDDNNAYCNIIEDGSSLQYLFHLNIQREILLEIKRKMGLNLNWDRTELGTWTHILFNVINPNNPTNPKLVVESLYLDNLNLTGHIPTEIGKLNSLSALNLGDNELNGRIPTEIGKLVNLIDLNLSDNQLTGEIPIEIGKLVNLLYLSLNKNKLVGQIRAEIGQLVNLEWLNLSNNQLTGEIPTEIGKLNLKILNLSNNQLTGKIPTEIGQLVNLRALLLIDNQLTREIPTEIGQLVKLITLKLFNNQLTGQIPTEIGQLVNLQYLYLNNNQLTGQIPTEIGQLVNLQYLYLNNNQLTGQIPIQIKHIRNLKLEDNNFNKTNNSKDNGSGGASKGGSKRKYNTKSKKTSR